MTDTDVIACRLPSEEAAHVRRVAHQSGVPISHLIRRALAESLGPRRD